MSEPKMMSPIDISFHKAFTEVVLPRFSELGQSPVVMSHTPLTSEQTRILTDHSAICLPSILRSWQELANPINTQRAINLAEIEPCSVDVFISFAALDFIEDIEGAIKNIERVLRPGGIILLTIKVARILDKDAPPFIEYITDPEAYGLTPGSQMPSMKVGRDWIINILSGLGLTAECHRHSAETTGKEPVEWFLARKPSMIHQASIINEQAPEANLGQLENTAITDQQEDSALGAKLKSKSKSKRRYSKIKKFGK